MIEAEEIKTNPVKEEATEVDVEILFKLFRESLENFQVLLREEKEKADNNNIDIKETMELTVTPNTIIVRVGDYTLFHQTKHWVYKKGSL